MMTNESDGLVVKIRTSKNYLAISVGVYLLSLFSVWHYFYNIWLSLGVSFVLSIWLANFLPKNVLLTQPDSITKIALNKKQITIEKNNQSTEQYPWFYPAYQSRFLVIIEAEKESVVVFKDAIDSQSLSQLNRYLNANT
ncbi:hypothetical protein [Candidatus Thioglobus sp.]|jgi:uncharacterized membrane protein|uniref:hypothetical protein n=1 Tax=Candidatus Thioglobus sp. TaxID=2026721 RepID=UPI001777F0F0|nr:hypothetical protein [Candidatus Thioglobus sp.]HIF48237.1 hypothetical protein [Candidatus Thioglobus sp.]HIL04064.1 hypothetical protein [Candidatus Thioglobus autotrophicus]